MKAVSRVLVLSITTLAMTVACVDDKKKSEAKKQDPAKTAAPGETKSGNSAVVEEALKAAREKQATAEELTNIVGNWRVTAISGGDANLNPLTAGQEVGLPESKASVQIQIEKNRIKILQKDGDLTFFRADLGTKITGKLIESTDTQVLALPALEFTVNSKDKITLKGFGRLSTSAIRQRRAQPVNASADKAATGNIDERPMTYELTRMNDADIMQPTENSVKLDYMLKAPNAQIITKFTGKAAPTPEQTGRLSCMIAKAGERQGLRIVFYERGTETPHGLILDGFTQFDFSKEAEQNTMKVQPEGGKEKFLGFVAKGDKRQKLVLRNSNTCSVDMNRKGRAVTFALKCAGLEIADFAKDATEQATMTLSKAAADEIPKIEKEQDTAASTELTEEEKKANAEQDVAQDEELAQAASAAKEENASSTEGTAPANERPSEIISATGSCHLQGGGQL